MQIRSTARKDSKTKNLIKRLLPGEIAVINHPDLDQVAAESLIKAKVKMVINAGPCVSGRYPNLGPELLLEAGIPILDQVGEECFTAIPDGALIEVDDSCVFFQDRRIGEGIILTRELLTELMQEARGNLHQELENFVQNTLDYALKEKELILGNLRIPEVSTRFKARQVLVVVRGQNYREDLKAIRSYIDEIKPVLVGVDGGADALLEAGFKPDLIIGDMDSVSDRALLSGAELIVHAYPDGRAPGLQRVQDLGLTASVFPAPGTSEDIALLLAYEKGADLIVAVGAHSNMIDFLEKGRKGMASTFLVRLKIGAILVDAKGVSLLYRSPIKVGQIVLLCMAALIPLAIVLMQNNPSRDVFRLLWLRLQVLFRW
ncbi:MAG TPA: hypothetical protein GXZ36_08760 [Firmicutes bacterium]|nr:hypothetical protein [Bacillota bacterium]